MSELFVAFIQARRKHLNALTAFKESDKQLSRYVDEAETAWRADGEMPFYECCKTIWRLREVTDDLCDAMKTAHLAADAAQAEFFAALKETYGLPEAQRLLQQAFNEVELKSEPS
jgi:predicted RNA-binding Zn ribbon-like protein